VASEIWALPKCYLNFQPSLASSLLYQADGLSYSWLSRIINYAGVCDLTILSPPAWRQNQNRVACVLSCLQRNSYHFFSSS
jgi:hypothetical protein